ncbi:autotransporter outer membrane beta-barrel domain-containing protein [Pseudohalioglobus sediminis]|uniref:autotransporter outer membrane beta-barrel domain-containing protein n=1 Tax=Pseudohalioglobus sediminis TaxID=2606449 RepID=UPI00165FC36F|nr:autotransporter outer membrane beta-barrel domain-containing protein [Pseudohalioglobus sediminis]
MRIAAKQHTAGQGPVVTGGRGSGSTGRLCLPWVLGMCLLHTPAGLAQTSPGDDWLDDLRDALQKEINNSNIGAGYVHMLSFFIEPNISASRLKADDADYDIFKLPLQYEIPGADDNVDVLLRATFSRARQETDFTVSEGEDIDAKWTAASAGFGAGLRWHLSPRLSLLAGADLGVSRLKSDADYSGGFSEEILAPILDGVLFNWDTNAWVASLATGLDYNWQWRERYDMSIKGRYTYSHIASYSESRDLQGFSESTGTTSLKLDMKHPWAPKLLGRSLFGIAHVGATAFTGSNRDALGFTHFYEFGYSVGVDLSADNRFLEDISIGYQLSTGTDVDGHSILVGWNLK